MKDLLHYLIKFSATLLSIFLLVTATFCQTEKTNSYNLSFDEYTVDSCLMDVLHAIEETDSNQLRFPGAFYFYQLAYADYSNYREITIRPSQWYRSLPKDTKGVVVVGNINFVLMGRFAENDPLFRTTGKKIDISIQYPTPPIFDTLDAKTTWKGWDKSPTALVGSMKFCTGSIIELRIDVAKKMESLGLKKMNSKMAD